MDTFELQTIVKFGENSLSFLESIPAGKIFIVTDPFMMESGMIKRVTAYLAGADISIFSDIVPDPPIELIVKGVDAVIGFRPETIIALGGGSAIDAAKAILYFSKKIGKLSDVKLIAIPTTSGTGSEVTSFAVITDKEKGIKYPLVSKELLPDIAILETELVKSVPSTVVADTGMDVLTHAVEAYVSTAAEDFSDSLAQRAVELVFLYLKRSYSNSEDKEAKEKMHHASCLAGIAFNHASLGLNHAIAHNIGGRLHIPHGRINTILLPYIIEFNADMEGYNPSNYTPTAKKYAYLAKLVGIHGSNPRILIMNLIQKIKKLQKDMEIPISLRECGLTPPQVEKVKEDLAEGTLNDSCILTNPRAASKNDILEIINKII